jgi:hypothetical protein
MILKYFVFWLSGGHGTSNFDRQSLIYSDLNYTNGQVSDYNMFARVKKVSVTILLFIGSVVVFLCWTCGGGGKRSRDFFLSGLEDFLSESSNLNK